MDTLSPLVAMHLLDRSCVSVGNFLKLHAMFPNRQWEKGGGRPEAEGGVRRARPEEEIGGRWKEEGAYRGGGRRRQCIGDERVERESEKSG